MVGRPWNPSDNSVSPGRAVSIKRNSLFTHPPCQLPGLTNTGRPALTSEYSPGSSLSTRLLVYSAITTTPMASATKPAQAPSDWKPQAQTEEQVAEGLRTAFRQAVRDGVVTSQSEQRRNP